jgi:hypothetical protein
MKHGVFAPVANEALRLVRVDAWNDWGFGSRAAAPRAAALDAMAICDPIRLRSRGSAELNPIAVVASVTSWSLMRPPPRGLTWLSTCGSVTGGELRTVEPGEHKPMVQAHDRDLLASSVSSDDQRSGTGLVPLGLLQPREQRAQRRADLALGREPKTTRDDGSEVGLSAVAPTSSCPDGAEGPGGIALMLRSTATGRASHRWPPCRRCQQARWYVRPVGSMATTSPTPIASPHTEQTPELRARVGRGPGTSFTAPGLVGRVTTAP